MQIFDHTGIHAPKCNVVYTTMKALIRSLGQGQVIITYGNKNVGSSHPISLFRETQRTCNTLCKLPPPSSQERNPVLKEPNSFIMALSMAALLWRKTFSLFYWKGSIIAFASEKDTTSTFQGGRQSCSLLWGRHYL